MSDAFDRFEDVVHRLGQVALLAATALVAYIMVTQMFEVAVRALGHPTTWVYDFNLAAIVGTVFLGIAGAERAGDNINVDFFTERLGPRANRVLTVFNGILALAFLAILIWFGLAVVLESIPASSSGRALALERARSASRAGLPQVGVLDSSLYSSLHPGYAVVFSGIYDSREEADRAQAAANAKGFSAAYVRQITR